MLQGFIMKKIALILSFLPFAAFAESDAEMALKSAISTVRTQCSGISVRMDALKKMAGIGTAVNAVGTATGVGGVVSGVVKYKKDTQTLGAMGEVAGADILIQKLKGIELSEENQRLLNMEKRIDPDIEKNIEKMLEEIEESEDPGEERAKKLKDLEERQAEAQSRLEKSQKEASLAGNIRTGLFAADTVTNVTGAVVSAKANVDESLAEKIKNCAEKVESLRTLNTRVRAEDGASANMALLNTSENILNRCSQYAYVDLTSLNKLAKGAIVSNSVGAVTGSAATITSVLGNNRKISSINIGEQNGAQELEKYNKINVTSNVLGGVTAAASLSGTILNASQIKKIKDVVNIATECEEALQW